MSLRRLFCYLINKTLWLSANDIVGILSIGRTSIFKQANSGFFKTILIGKMIRIFRKSFEDWLKIEEAEEKDE